LLDKFGFFAVTCTVETLTKIFEKVREENAEWLRLHRAGHFYIRGFYVRLVFDSGYAANG
jgi:hypothetical protein